MGKFLILSESGSGTGLGVRLTAEGHETKMKVFDSDYEGIGHGLVECPCEYTMGQTVVADCVGFGHVLEQFRDAGIPIFGGGIFADKLESDRELAEEVMRENNIDTPKSVGLRSWDDAKKAIKRLSQNSGRVVLKPAGALSGIVPSYVASDEEDALIMLKQFEKKFNQEPELTVQEYIKGVAVSTEGWFNGEEWAEGMFNHTIERKHFLCGDLGPSTGCTGNIVWPCPSDDPIVTQTLQKVTKTLRKHRYVGPIDINCVVNKEGVYGLEFTPRFGYDAFPSCLYSLCHFDFGSFVDTLSCGRMASERLAQGFGAGVRIGLPPWPSEKFHGDVGVPLRGLEERDKQWFYPYEVALVEDELQSSKGFGILGVVNGHGETVTEAFSRCYEIISRLRIPELQYRIDLSKMCLKDYRELEQLLSGDSGEWLGVDLDGTLASYSGWSDDIGEPIPAMVQRVKRWLRDGKDVRILTARGSIDEGKWEQILKICAWSLEHLGETLEVTHEKDPLMTRLYDDRVRQVEANEGVLVT